MNVSKIISMIFVQMLIFNLSKTESETSPCGICGVDVICKDRYPICSKNQVITLDLCGCCLVCKNILDKGEECSKDIDAYAVCKSGLECINSRCANPKTVNG
ncbi:unnamed protein product [Ceutorhynchus assimilis]|uniref:IGFBP N-terminal domain-containing protein n=1 Tax=Ceutorhynchus assimilis TaxID=467358 RepID=A0A9N9MYA8_9CUCU|nr:unnamed protein product [Ceutorhynchus assimilis]